MQVSANQIDDFKTDRKDITPPLPVILRLVPLLFYCSIAVAVILSALFFLQFRLATEKRDFHLANARDFESQTTAARGKRTALEAQIKKAMDIENWVAGSRPVQPLLVDITRSMDPKSAILDLRVTRDADSPSQLSLAMRLSTASTKQLDRTLETLAAQEFRTFSPTQSFNKGELDYRATLVRQSRLGDRTATPEPQ